MCTRRFTRPLGRAVQAAQFFRLGCLIVLAVAVSGMGARADDGQPFSTSGWSATSPGMLQVARTPSAVAVDEETSDAGGTAQDGQVGSEVGAETTAQPLDLGVSLERVGALDDLVDENVWQAARVARIASCHQASLGRYHSEEHRAFANALPASSRFDAAMTHFIAQRESRIQFDSCSSY